MGKKPFFIRFGKIEKNKVISLWCYDSFLYIGNVSSYLGRWGLWTQMPRGRIFNARNFG
nr:MAG TPA: hypothetical protein [Caudoviricetes sp.]